MKTLIRLLQIFLLAVAAVLLSLAHPFRWNEFHYEPSFFKIALATLGLLILMAIALRPVRGWVRFLCGVAFGVFYFGITLYWIAIALREFGDISWAVSIFTAVLLSIYCSLFIGFWAWISGKNSVRSLSPVAKALCWASLWAGLEAFRQVFLSGFHWGEIGYTISFFPALAKAASIWGVHGFTFLWIFVAALLFQTDTLLRSRASLRLAALTLLLVAAIGFLSTYYPRSTGKGEPVSIALIQPDIEQKIKWDPSSAEQILGKLIDLSKQSLLAKPSLIIWPETSFPFLVSSQQKQLPLSSAVPLITGAVVRDVHVNRNSALLVSADQIRARFDKQHLVPFGEYVPLQDYVPFGKLVANSGDFAPGSKKQRPFLVPDSVIRAGPLICYEDIFSANSVRHAKNGANLLVNLTNDAWYGRTSAQLQHLAMSKMQVFQTGLPMVRSTNNGVTAIVTRDFSFEAPSFKDGVFVQDVPIQSQPATTFFVWSYPLLEWIWFVIFAIALLWQDPTNHTLGRHPTRKLFFR